MARKLKADFAIIGAGCFGAWTALELARRGHSVILVDAHGPANSRASSGGETRIIRMSYGAAAHYSEMAQRSLIAWKTLFALLGTEELFQPTGALFTAPSGNAHLENSEIHVRRLKMPYQRWNWAELRKRFPQLTLPENTSGLYEPGAGILLARRAVAVVVYHAIQLGVKYLQMRAEPETIEGRLSADMYIYACGPWLGKLFPLEIGERIRATRQDVFFFGIPAGDHRFQMPAMPAWVDFHAGIYAVPDIENRGFKIAFDAHGPKFDPENGRRSVSMAALARMRERMAHCVPALQHAPLIESRVCQYENTTTGEFLIDRLRSNILVVGGGSGHGFKHGPAVGSYAADLAEGGRVPEIFSLTSKPVRHRRSVY
jgi:glycine/D-amino acid oxidase-like deaminating enzyme